MKKEDLKPFNAVIQICPECGKLDAYKDDGHDCGDELARQENQAMSDYNGWD